MNKCTFKTFVVGASNRLAYEAAKKVARRPGKAFNPLYIFGDTGLGATHLMQAIGHAVIKRNRDAKIAFITGEAFTTGFVDALQRRRLPNFRKHYRGLDVLLLDDIQYFAGKEVTQTELILILSDLLAAHKQIVLTSDRPVMKITNFSPRLASLCASGLITSICAPDQETRIAILRKKRKTHKVQVPDEVLEHIARHVHTDIRRLGGALIRVAADMSLDDRQLTLANVKHLLRDYVTD